MEGQPAQECIFCHIVSGRVASRKVYEDDKVVAILDINPANPGHMLIMPKEHYSVMPQLPDDIVERLSFVVKILSAFSMKALGAKGTTIFAANGVAAGQKASHFMIHVIPRAKGDNVGIEIPEQPVSKQQLVQTRRKMAQLMANAFGTEVDDEIEEQETDEAPDETDGKTPSLDDLAKFLSKK